MSRLQELVSKALQLKAAAERLTKAVSSRLTAARAEIRSQSSRVTKTKKEEMASMPGKEKDEHSLPKKSKL